MNLTSGLTRRIIPCLDVADGKVVKGVQFRNHRIVGEIRDLALRYRDQGADELVLYDITASPDQRMVDVDWVQHVARVIDIPFCVAGGIASLEAARRVLYSGADKVSVNSPALENPSLIGELAAEFGKQCVVVGIDSLQTDDGYQVKQLTGRPDQTRDARRTTFEWIQTVQELGAGEIVLNCMNQDGVRTGYDISQLRQAREICAVPLIASGGAGEIRHFTDVFSQAGVDGALAATVFHDQIVEIEELKATLQENGIEVRR